MSRFEELLATVETYQSLADENYKRIRKVAEDLRAGLCAYMLSGPEVCVQLVPPGGPFEPKPYGDQAFSIPPKGFRPLGPVAFGLAVRVSKGTDWLRVTMECRKIGENFIVQIIGGDEYQTKVPLGDHDPEPLYKMIYRHVYDWFNERIERYQEGDYGTREIGFDFAVDLETAEV